jgi:hypothetical protein
VEFEYRYFGQSSVQSGAGATSMSFAPDTLREPTWFRGALDQRLPFREAISALHSVVTSDLRFKPKDRTEYLAWRAEQDKLLDIEGMALRRQGSVQARIRELTARQRDLMADFNTRNRPYYAAQQKYFDYLYKNDRDAWWVLDPVITVHPDEVFFECFSEDEATYGRLGVQHAAFKDAGDFQCGTTNIDYSYGLYDAFQKIRDYKDTVLEVDPSGFEVQTTNEATFREEKIDLPESWVRGFLQVSAAMTLPMTSFDLHPMDVHAITSFLRQNRARTSPRALRYHLTPGQPVKMVFEPWNRELICHRSRYTGDTAQEIRVWGRRRLSILERLVPVTKRFTVHLLGSGMPSFYIADLGDLHFTLGLSGWTKNNWSSQGNFDLMAPRAAVDGYTTEQVFAALKQTWLAEPRALARRLGLQPAVVSSALGMWTQAGRAIFDLRKGVYRARELAREPVPMESLRLLNPVEQEARSIVARGGLRIRAGESKGRITLRSKVQGEDAELVIDDEGRMLSAKCTCSQYVRDRLYKGPCVHLLAIRIGHQAQNG